MDTTQAHFNKSKPLNLTVHLCGNPRPDVTMKFGDDELNVLYSNMTGRKHAYVYQAVVSKSLTRTDCGKSLSYKAINRDPRNADRNVTKEDELQIIVNCKLCFCLFLSK